MRGYRTGGYWNSLNQSYFNGTSWNTGITYYNGFPLAFFDGVTWVYFIDWYIIQRVWELGYFNGQCFFTGTYTTLEHNTTRIPIWATETHFINRDNTTGYGCVCTNCGYNGYPAFFSNYGSGSEFYLGGSTTEYSYGWIVIIEWQISIGNWSTPYFSGQQFWNGTAWIGPGEYWDGSEMVTGNLYANGMYINLFFIFAS